MSTSLQKLVESGLAMMVHLIFFAHGDVRPAPGVVTANPFPGFQWMPHAESFRDVAYPVEYEIRILRETSDGVKIVDEDRVALSRYVHAHALDPGRYRWQVRSCHRGMPGAWTEESAFTICQPERIFHVNVEKGLVEGFKNVLNQADREKVASARIVIPPGDHRIEPPFEGYVFDVSGRSNWVIDGRGAHLRFSSRKQGLMLAKNAKDIAIMGFECSFAKGCLRVQGTVRSIDSDQKFMTLTVDEGFSGFDASDHQKQDILYLLEPGKNGRLKSGAPNFLRAAAPIVRGTSGAWTFQSARALDFCRVGDRYAFNFRSGSRHLIDASESHGVTLSGLTTSGWGGMQFVSMEGSDMRVLNCKTRTGEGEWMTGNADGVHIRGHQIGPWIEGLEIHSIGDDAVALYARPVTIKAVVASADRRTAICRADFFHLEPGNDVSFFHPLEGRILLETKVVKVIQEKGTYRVSFAEELPEGIRCEGPMQQATQIWNRSKSCGDFMIRNSRFANIRRYGTVFRSRGGVLEKNHYVGISSRAVVFRNEAEWPNGLYASEIIIRGNTIEDTGFDHPDPQPAMAFLFSGYKCGAHTIGPRNILVENNSFKNRMRPEIQLTWSRNVLLRNNHFMRPDGVQVPAQFQARNSEEIRHESP